MARKATGTLVKAKNGLWQAVVTLTDGSRKRLPPFPAGTSEKMAREKAAHYAERVRELGLESGTPRQPKPDAKVSCEAWIATWHAARVAKGFSSARVSLGHWTEHLRPILGSKHPKDWTRDDFRSVSKALDDTSNSAGKQPRTFGRRRSSWLMMPVLRRTTRSGAAMTTQPLASVGPIVVRR